MTDDFVANALGQVQPVEPRPAFADRLFEQFSAALSDDVPPGNADVGDVVAFGELEAWTDDGDDHDRRRLHQLLAAVAAVVLVAAVAVGAWGGRDSGVVATQPTSQQQFIAGADAICQLDNVSLTRLYASSSQNPAALQAGIVAILGDVVARFGQLSLPPADTVRVRPALDDLSSAHQLARAGLASYAAVRRAAQVLFDYGAIACNPDLVPLYPTTTAPSPRTSIS